MAASEALSDPWAQVDSLMGNFHNLTDCDGCNCKGCHGFAFTAGNATHRAYSYAKGSTKLTSPLLLASASKFPAAIAISGAVADGHLTFDTHAHEVFPWWTDDAADPRSGVTLRNLLSFTSGFYWADASSGNVSCMAGIAGSILCTPEECAQQIYTNAPFKFKSGTTFAYNSFHLQLAGAMAAKAADITLQELLHQNLITKLGLKHSGWLVGQVRAFLICVRQSSLCLICTRPYSLICHLYAALSPHMFPNLIRSNIHPEPSPSRGYAHHSRGLRPNTAGLPGIRAAPRTSRFPGNHSTSLLEHSANIPRTFREHSANFLGTVHEPCYSWRSITCPHPTRPPPRTRQRAFGRELNPD